MPEVPKAKKDILEGVGMGEHVRNMEQGKCPFCGEQVDTSTFKDPLSKKEFEISGLCQSCQDDTFGP
jgi:C4-type Zn-finger protein